MVVSHFIIPHKQEQTPKLKNGAFLFMAVSVFQGSSAIHLDGQMQYNIYRIAFLFMAVSVFQGSSAIHLDGQMQYNIYRIAFLWHGPNAV
jgi:hypothetical protein